jgi:hypothetical protein
MGQTYREPPAPTRYGVRSAHSRRWRLAFSKDSPVNGTSAPVFRLMSDS